MAGALCRKGIEIGHGEAYWTCDLPAGHGGVIHETDGKRWRDPDVEYVKHNTDGKSATLHPAP